jgi:hypothetical protein
MMDLRTICEEQSQKDIKILHTPEYKWKCCISPTFSIMVEEGHQPNVFHRLMQRLILGFCWTEI